MGKDLSAWKAAVVEAQKTIGKQGKLPKPKGDIAALMDAANKAIKKVMAERDTVEKSVLDVQDALSKVYNASESYSDIVDASNFGLNEDDKVQAKQIAEAQKTLTDVLKDIMDHSTDFQINMETFNKHLANFEKDLKASHLSN